MELAFPMIAGRVSGPILLLAMLAGAAGQEATFSTQSNVVLVPALVKDGDGHAVYGLQARDFVVEDDGVEQKINVDEDADSEPVSVVVVLQCGREARREFGRMRGLGSMLEPILAPAQNQMALVEFDSKVNLVRDFTHNSSLIEEDLKNLDQGDGGAAILDAVDFAVQLLAKVPEGSQRVVLLVSETRDHGSHMAKLADVVARIGSSNTVVYALAFSPALSNVLDTERGTNQDAMNASPDITAVLALAMQAARRNTPKAIASMTGGEYELFESRKRFETHLIDFTNHLHSRYLLSFQPKGPHPGLHQLVVHLRTPAKETVLSRSSYWAAGAASAR